MPEESKNENPQGNTSTVSELAQMVETLKKEREEAQKVIAEQKELITRNLLGGVTNNAPVQEVKKVESAKEYAQRVLNNKVELK